MMLTPWGPRAVPTGGAGVAAPACSWTLTSAAIFFLGGIALRVSFVVVRRGHREPDRLCHLALLGCPSYVGNRTILVRFGQDVKSASPGVRRLCRRSSLSRPRGPVSVSSDQVRDAPLRPLASLGSEPDAPQPLRLSGPSQARVRASDLLDLGEAELHRGLTAEDL